MVKAGVRHAASTDGPAADACGAAAAPPNGEGRWLERGGSRLWKKGEGDAAAAEGGGGGGGGGGGSGDGQRDPHVTARRRGGG